MARPLAPLDKLAAHAAMDYLERALERRADVFSVPMSDARVAFFELQASRAHNQAWLDAANVWFDTFLSPTGRTKMLAALRQRRAGPSDSSTTMRVSRATHAELVSLASKLDVPLSSLLAGMLHLARRDKQLQTGLKQFSESRKPTR